MSRPTKLIYIVLLCALLVKLILFQYSQRIYTEGEEIQGQGEVSDIKIQGFKNVATINGLFVEIPTDTKIDYGQEIKFTGVIKCNKNGPCISPAVKKAKIQILNNDINVFLKTSFELRTAIQNVYFDNLNRQQANLLSGVVIGNIGLDANFRNKLAVVGLTHVVAASGMNVTMVAAFLSWIISITPIKRLFKILLIWVGLFVYAAIAGFAPPIVRAVIMASCLGLGGIFGRKNNSYLVLIITGYIMLWVDSSLPTNISFLLTFASMMGQITVSKVSFAVPKLFQPMIEILLQTWAAILFTLPIVLMFFSTFSLISMISNLLVLWTVEPLMLLGGVAGIIGLAFPAVANLLLIPAGVLLGYFLWIVKILSNQMFLFKFQGFNIFMALGYYFILGIALYYLMYRNASKN